ncbi:MAG TPA: sulfotransferase [Planctomycetia bacterium]|nr:sulfotransferase [Planctomycetia bacterium]
MTSALSDDAPVVARWRRFLCDHLFSSLGGVSLGPFARMLAGARGRIPPRYWPRAAFLVGGAVGNAALGWVDRLRKAPTSFPPPLFLLGHWRSGTTLLHELLSLDPRFVAPTFVQCLFPSGFRVAGPLLARMLAASLPADRGADDVPWGPHAPAEDEFAMALAGLSPYLAWSFPHDEARYARYLDFADLAPASRVDWLRLHSGFIAKVADGSGRTPLLKSPPHLGRLAALAAHHPEAKFILLHRRPEDVFASTRRMVLDHLAPLRLQRPEPRRETERIVEWYGRLHRSGLAAADALAPGRLVEVAFEELTGDPPAALRRLYRDLELGGSDAVEPRWRRYLESRSHVRPTAFATLEPEWRRKLEEAAAPVFDRWGYRRAPATVAPAA